MALDVAAPVRFDPAQFPDGVNVEVLTAPVDGAVSMRVHERGVGETRSCGTGTVAAAVAALRHGGAETGTLRVRIPGGEVTVTITDATSYLRGPSVLVARGEISEDWWHAQRPVNRMRNTDLRKRQHHVTTMTHPNSPRARANSTSKTAPRCAASPGCPPNSPTSPRSNTGSCAWNASCWSACGPTAAPPTPTPASPSSPRWPRPPAPRCSKAWSSGATNPTHRPTSARARRGNCARSSLATGADTVICDGELSPAQLNSLEKVVKVKVIDRTALILDIFAQHATSAEGKAQVAFAQMEYMLPQAARLG